MSSESTSIKEYNANNSLENNGVADDDEPVPIYKQPSRRSSIAESISNSYSFFHSKLSTHRRKLGLKFLFNYLVLSIGVLGVFSIYWGSMYGRLDRIKNLRMLVVIDDMDTIDNIPPLFGDYLREVLQTDEAKIRGDWHIYNGTEFLEMARQHNGNNITQEIERQVHHQYYWSSIYVKPNATYNFFQALLQNNGDYNVSANSIVSIYETGRDFLNMNQYVTPSIQLIEKLFLTYQSNITERIVEDTDISINSRERRTLISTPFNFLYIDRIPYNDPVLVAPSQVGLIYMVILTFFNFNFFNEIHQSVVKLGVKKLHFLIYRYFASVLSYFILSLLFGLVTLAFQVDFTVTYGKSGFLVYWMIAFMTMLVVGFANEIMAMILIPTFPPLLGFWMLFWVIINISPTFTPIALSPEFYRFGYAMPIHNSYEATKTVFFDISKYQLGRNFGILAAWIVFLSCVFPFVVAYFGKTMGKKVKEQMEKTMKEREEVQMKENGTA
ncbi:unnamed protein product [Candida verbasci]|uniref:DUF3533 domain-containing protein n=1 Tax=Candida verbasci TaxID=1227364 RepID=A0A9W4TVM8_9ASCO|nr:unnamed protein product [Candida verbasci]